MANTNGRTIYYIPDNFIKEGRILQGRIRLWYLADAVILALCGMLIGLIAVMLMRTKPENTIVILISFGGLPFIAGLTGFNGDRIPTTIASANNWRKHKVTMLKNPRPRYLTEDPVDALINSTTLKDRVAAKYEERLAERRAEKSAFELKDGEDYRFEKDESIDKYAVRPGKIRPARQLGKDEAVVLDTRDTAAIKDIRL